MISWGLVGQEHGDADAVLALEEDLLGDVVLLTKTDGGLGDLVAQLAVETIDEGMVAGILRIVEDELAGDDVDAIQGV